MKKILLIEDNKDISDNIKDYLTIEGFKVKQIFRGDDGLDEAISGDYDLILLDISLPGISGYEVLKNILKNKNIPIIYTTAKDNIEDKLLGLSLGANDYIVKPFDLRELLARINIHLNNSNIDFISDNKIFTKDDIYIDFDKRIFKKGDTNLNLTQKEFLLLEILTTNNPNVVSRTDIIQYIWGGDITSGENEGKLDVYVSNLRTKFGKDFIHTIKGVGYKV